MRLVSPGKTVSIVAILLMSGLSAQAASPQKKAPKPHVAHRAAAKPKVSKPQHRAAVKPKVVHPHHLAGPHVKVHPLVIMQPTHAYHRAYMPYGYHHSRSYHRRYGSYHRTYRHHGRYGRTNQAFQKAQAEMRRLQGVAMILNNVPRGGAVNPNVVTTLQQALTGLVVKGHKPSSESVHALATDLVSTLESRTRPLAEPMQLAYDMEAILNGHVITPAEVNMAMSSTNTVLRYSGVPSARMQMLNADMRQVALGSTATQRRR